ncbi:MAG: ISL3 family transposase, partial [Magnetococcales bacterium]|nr:ISL3 family transposase [Magnetococcales bacterium]
MDPSTLFGLALGLTPPWEVWSINFSPEARRLDLSIGFPMGSSFTCPVCGSKG